MRIYGAGKMFRVCYIGIKTIKWKVLSLAIYGLGLSVWVGVGKMFRAKVLG